MAMRRGPRMAVGSAAWIAEERSSALQIAQSETEEFSYAARNEVDWLNEHMAEIFSENQMNVADLFKTPGKLRGKTPRTARKPNPAEARMPLSDIFSATPKGQPTAFARSLLQGNQNRTPTFKVAEDKPRPAHVRPEGPSKQAVASPRPQRADRVPVTDSGYHGSELEDVMDVDEQENLVGTTTTVQGATATTDVVDFGTTSAPVHVPEPASPTAESAEDISFRSAREEQTRQGTVEPTAMLPPPSLPAGPSPIREQSASPTTVQSPVRYPQLPSPNKTSPAESSPQRESPARSSSDPDPVVEQTSRPVSAEHDDSPRVDAEPAEPRSPSDGSSPIRPPVRKSSLNFASLPAREPLTSNKSLGARMSRTSHLEQTRQSYYSRHTGGKSLGTTFQGDMADDHDHDHDHDDGHDDEHDDMDLDENLGRPEESVDSNVATHNKTYTQRLQDQISMLGKSQGNSSRPSKSIANLLPSQQGVSASYSQPTQPQAGQEIKAPASPKNKQPVTTPGAFPEDDEDEWIEPPSRTPVAARRPSLVKSHTADIMEGVSTLKASDNSGLPLPKSRPGSPGKAGIASERLLASPAVHGKSSSVPSFPDVPMTQSALRRLSPVSNPTLPSVLEGEVSATPKSPSRTLKESPLKQVKNKLSSILKSSKGLLASSAALSADGKASLLSPSSSRLALHIGASVESFQTANNVLYPDLSQHGSAVRPGSPSRTASNTRKTRASVEREKREAKERDKEAKEREKEAKEAKRLADQMDKLQKARDKEREKARVFSKEQEKIVEMERQVAAQKEQERKEQERQEQERREKERREQERREQERREQERREQERREQERKEQEVVALARAEAEAEAEAEAQAQAQAAVEAKAEAEAQAKAEAEARAEAEAKAKAETDEIEAARARAEAEAKAQALADAQAAAKKRKQIAETPTRPRSPTKATRASPRKTKTQAADDDVDMIDVTSTMPPPSVPRPTTTPATRGPATRRTAKPPPKDAHAKAKQAPTVIRVNTTSSQHTQFHPSNNVLAATLQDTLGPQHQAPRQLTSKASQASLQTKSSHPSLNSSVSSSGRPKALDLAAKKREREEREAQRKREAKLETERRRLALQEEEQQRREQQRKLEAEKQKEKEEERKQAALAAAQAKKDPARQAALEKAKQTKAPPPAVRSQPNGPPDYSLVEKAPARPPSRMGSTMHQDTNYLVNSVLTNAAKIGAKRPLQQDANDENARPGPAQRNGPSYQPTEAKRIRMSEEFDEDIDVADSQRNIKGAPVRPSGGFKKDLPAKPLFPNGYTPVTQSATRDLFKTTVTTQHNNQVKAAHPRDMAQLSKAAIPFAPNNPAGASYKTPARPAGVAAIKSAAKSAKRSSPRFQNGETIELPEIQTDDDEDEDDDDGGAAGMVAAWAESPELRMALMRQEPLDPMQIFGPPAPLNMEEVFNKHKDRWHKFRGRTSSANWSGADRLTDDDVRKDLQARDKMRREGGWSYDLGRELN